MNARFHDRRDAGRELARRISADALVDPVVLALPRGGLPVAAEVAEALGAPLDILVVRKLGVPGQPELAMGAVASGGVRVMNEEVVRGLGISEEAIRPVLERELKELERRERAYRRGREASAVEGRSVVLVDDGVATGSSMLAGLKSLRLRGAGRILAAVPVAPPETLGRLEDVADEVVCVLAPEPFYAISPWYREFPQLEDDEVRAILDEEGPAAEGSEDDE